METNPVAVQAEEAVDASVAAFAAVLAGSDSAVSGAASGAAGGPEASIGFDDDPLQRVADGALDVLAGVARSEAKLAALKVQAVAVLAAARKALHAPAPLPYEAAAQERSLVAEVGCALAIGERAAGALLAESYALTLSLPCTFAALQSGTISWAHARTMVDQTVSLDPATAAALEAHFLDPHTPRSATECPAGEMPAYRFKAKARIWRERHHPESIEKRQAKGLADRRMEYAADRDGMGWISLYLPAHQANAAWNRTRALARGLQGPDEPRTLSQSMADLGASALLGSGSGSNPAEVPSPKAHVLVTVPVLSLLDLTDEPAMLDGHGPIPASMARDLVANGSDSFFRVLVDPRDGAPLEIGRTSYRLTKAMRNWLRMRDGKCPFPGCSNHSLDNEADHILAWHQGGTTGISNLGQPCPKHHKLRHTSGWKPIPATKAEPPGWISPSGRSYKSEHQDWEPTHWPEQRRPEVKTRLQTTGRLHPTLCDAVSGHVDFVPTGLSPGEDGLEKFLHART